jgi:hypothetical protein
MTAFFSKPVRTLNDLFTEPIHKTIGSFNYFGSSYGLEPFKLVTFKNSILISRFKMANATKHPLHENYFLSVLLVKTSISLEEVNDFVIDLAASKKLSHSALTIYKNVLQAGNKNGCNSGKDWAIKQARLGQRLLLSIAKEAGIETEIIENFDRNVFNDILELDENKWEIYAAFKLSTHIKNTPSALMNSTYSLN